MICRRCAFENPAGMAFCGRCGAQLSMSCPSCGFASPEGFVFCGKCGAKLGAGGTPPSPAAYTPKHLAERILTSKGALEGERKQVTVLFADVKGSMELLADRDPEEARKLLDPVLERMMEAVHRYEGTVNQVMGDGIMALFGAPVAHEDHAVRACYAALDMQAALRPYAEELRRSHGVTVQIRVGLNSGEVVVRAIGSDLRMDYSAVGQTTHLAARMEQLASPGATLLTADTLRLAEGYVEVKPLGPVPVRGLEAPVEIYELAGAGPRRSRLHAAAARGLTRFVGRDAELEQLRQALARTAAGHGQVVAIVGEPGVGKSRLVWEVTHSHRTHGWLLLQAGSVSYGKATAYLPVIDLLKVYFGIQERDDPRAIREKVTGKVLTLDRTLEPDLPALLALLEVPPEDPQWQTFDPAQRRLRTFDSIRRLLLRESQVQPLLAVFEDLHWIDSETQALLDRLVESLPTARVLLLVNYRPEYRHGWGSKTYYSQLRLDPLPPESADELLHALLGADPGLAPLKRLLVERTEGNPFFLEESVRTLVEAQVLTGDRGGYRLERPLGSIQVPATVQAVLAARIDRLPPEVKQLLQAASVVGTDVPFSLLQVIADVVEDELRAGLERLQAGEFLYETRLFPDLEYTFKHALTHEVAYGSLLQERRRALHGRIVDAIERLYADRLTEQVERLAHHAFRGELWEKAVAYGRQAGAKVYARSVAPEAIAHFEQALAALGHLPETRAKIEQAIDLRLDLRNPLAQLVEYERSLGQLREAERLATAIGDRHRLGQVDAFLAFACYQTGDLDGAVEHGRRAAEIAEEQQDADLEAVAHYFVGQACFFGGDYPRAMRHYERAWSADARRRAGGGSSVPRRPAVIRSWTALCAAETGRFPDALAYAAEADQVAEAMQEPFSRVAADFAIGTLHLNRGALERAIPVLERGLERCRAANVAMYSHRLLGALGYGYCLSGRVADGVGLIEEAVELFRSKRLAAWRARTEAWLAEAYLLAGRPDDARRVAERALETAREYGERSSEAWVLRLLGEIAARRDPPDAATAEAHLRKALALAEELGMRPLVAHCHLGLGKLYRRMGKGQQAQEQLTKAAAMYREMDMPFWLEQAEAELAGARRPS
ncbi:MAG: AAA family ATPase [Candidatus Rokubacteria bacterium]|nr:AAA family ATPase [Candidatus Rokubacteria bacterium]